MSIFAATVNTVQWNEASKSVMWRWAPAIAFEALAGLSALTVYSVAWGLHKPDWMRLVIFSDAVWQTAAILVLMWAESFRGAPGSSTIMAIVFHTAGSFVANQIAHEWKSYEWEYTEPETDMESEII